MAVTLAGLIKSFKLVVNPVFNTSSNTNATKLFTSICETFFDYTQDQISQLYNNSFLTLSSGNALDEYISQFSELLRKDGETDDSFRTRYLKFHFQYNSTEPQIKLAIEDITGLTPLRVINLAERHAYWGEANAGTGTANTLPSYYGVEYDDNKALWGADPSDSAFKAYVELDARPSQPMLDELFNILSQLKVAGTKIYIKYPQLHKYDYISATYDEGCIYF